MKSIKEMVAGGKLVKFMFYRHGELWYTTECGFEFPVPIDDTGDGVFMHEDKAMLFMRYIRKHLAYLEQSAKDQAEGKPTEFSEVGSEVRRGIVSGFVRQD
jgi:hypothetical protein